MIAIIGVFALVLRVYDLDAVPAGLHGDEGATGIDARRIIDGVDIFPYTNAAWGQPSGPMYWTVPWVKLLGPEVIAVRLPMALLGVGTVVTAFFAFRLLFGRPTAYFAAIMLTLSSWLLFYNRTGYTVSAMPFTEMASLLAVAVALRRGTWPWFIAAGVVVGAGIYGYFAYPLFAAGLAVWVVVHAALERPRPLLLHLRNLAVMGLTALLVIQPMMPYLNTADRGYRKDRAPFTISHTPEYRAADLDGKLDLYWDNAKTVMNSLRESDHPDGSDGSGTTAALDPLSIGLAAAGSALCLYYAWRRRSAAYLLPFIIVPFVLVGPISSVGSQQRRSLGILPFVILPAAVLLGLMWDHLRGNASTTVALGVSGVLIAIYGNIHMDNYWSKTRNSYIAWYVFAPELEETAKLIRDQPVSTKVYLASHRWSVGYETFRYLVPDRAYADGTMEDRSKQFGTPGYEGIDRARPSLLILMHEYVDDAAQVTAMYPSAVRQEGPWVVDHPAYVAYFIPPAVPGGR